MFVKTLAGISVVLLSQSLSLRTQPISVCGCTPNCLAWWFRSCMLELTWLLLLALSPLCCVTLDTLLTSLSRLSFLSWTTSIYHVELFLGLMRSCNIHLSQRLIQNSPQSMVAAAAVTTCATATVPNTSTTFPSIAA